MRRKKAYLYLLHIFIPLIIFATPLNALSKEPRVENLTVNSDSKNLYVSFDLKSGFSRDIEKAMLSGIPTTFTFFIEIYREKALWPDKKVASFKFSRVCKYNPLKEEFEIFQEENPENHIYVKDISEVKKVMTVGKNIAAAPLFLFSEDKSYKLRVKAELDTIELPFPLNYLLFFVSFWDYETPWLIKRFNIVKGAIQILPRS